MATLCSRVKDKRVERAAPDVQPEWLTANQLCQQTQAARHTIRKAIAAGVFEVLDLGPKTKRYRLRKRAE